MSLFQYNLMFIFTSFKDQFCSGQQSFFEHMAGGPGTGLCAGDTEKEETSFLSSRTQSSGDRHGRGGFPSSVVTAGGMRAQTWGLMEELLQLKKNKKQNQKPDAGEPANSLMTGMLCFSIFIGLIRMEASVTRFVVVSDILTGLILLSCPPSIPLSPSPRWGQSHTSRSGS